MRWLAGWASAMMMSRRDVMAHMGEKVVEASSHRFIRLERIDCTCVCLVDTFGETYYCFKGEPLLRVSQSQGPQVSSSSYIRIIHPPIISSPPSIPIHPPSPEPDPYSYYYSALSQDSIHYKIATPPRILTLSHFSFTVHLPTSYLHCCHSPPPRFASLLTT